MTETLTAEERALLENLGGMFEQSAKLLRLYDSALARAEAAEATIKAEDFALTNKSHECNEWMSRTFEEKGRRKAAESRLAEARELIMAFLHAYHEEGGDDVVNDAVDNLTTFAGRSSSTPAPAAPCDGSCANGGVCPAPAAESEPDTAQVNALDGYKACLAATERDSAEKSERLRALESRIADLATARARIAELEAESVQWAKASELFEQGAANIMLRIAALEGHRDQLGEVIAQAVAELEDLSEPFKLPQVRRALALLRGNRT